MLRVGTLPRLAWLVLALLMGGGCGPAYYPVHGKVTLDDQPLPNALVMFLPEEEGIIPPIARTDEKGEYELTVTVDTGGVSPGKYKVRITTYDEGDLSSVPPIPGTPERVPAVYNTQTTLTAEVKPDSEAPIDFALSSSAGPVVQPK